jgi:hypothetical protein
MNTATAISTYIFGVLVVVLIGVVIRRMLRGWKHRAQRQSELIGDLPPAPVILRPAVIPPTRGLYLGSTIAPNWLERVNVGDLGYRCKAVLTRYPEGILVERSGTGPIWMPAASISGVRTERAMAGKVLPGGGAGRDGTGRILVIRWRLPSGTEIDTGFRGEDRSVYDRWIDPTPTDREVGESQ